MFLFIIPVTIIDACLCFLSARRLQHKYLFLTGIRETTSQESLLENREVWKRSYRSADILHRSLQNSLRFLRDRQGNGGSLKANTILFLGYSWVVCCGYLIDITWFIRSNQAKKFYFGTGKLHNNISTELRAETEDKERQ